MYTERAAKSYDRSRAKGGSPRETEGRALLEAARRMAEAQTAPADKEELRSVARLNWRLWTIFQAEISLPTCPLPTDIRQNMLNLCNFVDKHTVQVLADPHPKNFNVLISLNRQIAAGLLTDAGPQSASIAEPGRATALQA